MQQPFVPQIVDEIFKKYETKFDIIYGTGGTERHERNTKLINSLCLELTAIFGELLVQYALELLDNASITLYRAESENVSTLIDIVPKKGTRNPIYSVKLLRDANYCPCPSFARDVLKLRNGDEALTNSNNIIYEDKLKETHAESAFTCQHILAARMAILFRSSCLHRVVVSDKNLQHLLDRVHDQ